jgi:hypothetical protein|tara:strand:- start:850 stop:1047 length:198 start_codon:yes stop_codon:yes gene_type:complete
MFDDQLKALNEKPYQDRIEGLNKHMQAWQLRHPYIRNHGEGGGRSFDRDVAKEEARTAKLIGMGV